MAGLIRNSRSIMTRFACIHRTATTTAAGAGSQVKTAGATTTISQASRAPYENNMAVRDSRQRSSVS